MANFHHVCKLVQGRMSLYYTWFSAMHTRIDIAIYSGQSESDLNLLIEQVYHEIVSLERMCNFYSNQSEAHFLNETADKSPVRVSDELFHIVSDCVNYNQLTLGCFDVTVNSLNYHSGLCKQIVLDNHARTIFFAEQGIKIDLSGYIKGYALDKVKLLLMKGNIQNALISLGNSSILSMGNHPCGNGWKLDNDIILQNQCLSVSGNNSSIRKHIISPSTGKFVEGYGKCLLVTKSGKLGEILSTAFFAASQLEKTKLKEIFNQELISYKEIYN